jgi:putative transposase
MTDLAECGSLGIRELQPTLRMGLEDTIFGGRKVLAEVANVARPDTILAWYRKLVAHKFDGSRARRSRGRPRIKREVEQLIVRMARENRDWGYDRIAGALANLGYQVCDQTVGNVLHRHAVPPRT